MPSYNKVENDLRIYIYILYILFIYKINIMNFDFGIIKTLGGEISPRRQKIVNFLKSNHFSINII